MYLKLSLSKADFSGLPKRVSAARGRRRGALRLSGREPPVVAREPARLVRLAIQAERAHCLHVWPGEGHGEASVQLLVVSAALARDEHRARYEARGPGSTQSGPLHEQ